MTFPEADNAYKTASVSNMTSAPTLTKVSGDVNAPSNSGSINLTAFSKTVKFSGTASSSQSIATTGSGTNGGYGGRITFSTDKPTSALNVIIDTGLEACIQNVQSNAFITFYFDNASFYGYSGSYSNNFVIGENGVRVNGGSNDDYVYAGAISGTGRFAYITANSANRSNTISGDTSAFYGTWTRNSTTQKPAKRTYIFGEGSACQSGIVGGTIGTTDLPETVKFNYSGAYTVRGEVYSDALTVVAGTATFNQTVDATTFSVSSGATADLSNTTVVPHAAIANSGTVRVGATTVINLANLTPTAIAVVSGEQVYKGLSYTVVSGNGNIENLNQLTTSNFSGYGENLTVTSVDTSTSGTIVLVTDVDITDHHDLTWNYNGSGNWTTAAGRNWIDTDEISWTFVNGYNALFTKALSNFAMQLTTDIAAGTVTVGTATTFNMQDFTLDIDTLNANANTTFGAVSGTLDIGTLNANANTTFGVVSGTLNLDTLTVAGEKTTLFNVDANSAGNIKLGDVTLNGGASVKQSASDKQQSGLTITNLVVAGTTATLDGATSHGTVWKVNKLSSDNNTATLNLKSGHTANLFAIYEFAGEQESGEFTGTVELRQTDTESGNAKKYSRHTGITISNDRIFENAKIDFAQSGASIDNSGKPTYLSLAVNTAHAKIAGLSNSGVTVSNNKKIEVFSGYIFADRQGSDNGSTFYRPSTETHTLEISVTEDQTFDGDFISNLNIVKTGASTLTLNGTNTYTGVTTINEGTLKLGNASALGVGEVSINAGGTLNLNGNNIKIASLTGSGSIADSDEEVVITVTGSSSDFTGNIGQNVTIKTLIDCDEYAWEPHGFTKTLTVRDCVAVERNNDDGRYPHVKVTQNDNTWTISVDRGANLIVMPLGDSITHGSAPGYNYRKPLFDGMYEDGWNIRSTGFWKNIYTTDKENTYQPYSPDCRMHNGISGQRIMTASTRAGYLQSIDNYLDVAGYPDIITMMIGTNDENNDEGGGETAFAQWKVLVKRILELRPNAHLIVSPIIARQTYTDRDKYRSEYNSRIEELFDLETATEGITETSTWRDATYPALNVNNEWVPFVYGELKEECVAEFGETAQGRLHLASMEAAIGFGASNPYIIAATPNSPLEQHPNADGYARMAAVWRAAIEKIATRGVGVSTDKENPIPIPLQVLEVFNPVGNLQRVTVVFNRQVKLDGAVLTVGGSALTDLSLSDNGRRVTGSFATGSMTVGEETSVSVTITPELAADATTCGTTFSPVGTGAAVNVPGIEEAGFVRVKHSDELSADAGTVEAAQLTSEGDAAAPETIVKQAYYLELARADGETHYVWVESDPFQTAEQMGIPSDNFQRRISGLRVVSNAPSVKNTPEGTTEIGYVSFSPRTLGTTDGAPSSSGVPAGLSGWYDWNDSPDPSATEYGGMQMFRQNAGSIEEGELAASLLFAYNRFTTSSDNEVLIGDLAHHARSNPTLNGIFLNDYSSLSGQSPAEPFGINAYVVRKMEVWVKGTTVAPYKVWDNNKSEWTTSTKWQNANSDWTLTGENSPATAIDNLKFSEGVNKSVAISGGAIGAANLYVENGSYTLTAENPVSLTVENETKVSNGATLAIDPTVELFGMNPIKVGAESKIQFNSSIPAVSVTGVDADDAGTVVLNNDSEDTVLLSKSNLLTGSIAVEKNGTGAVTIDANQDYTGGTTLTAGELGFVNNLGATTGTVTLNGGTLAYKGTSNTASLSNPISVPTNKTGTIDPQGHTNTLSGVVTVKDGGTLCKVGEGTLVLSDTTSAPNGTLRINSNAVLLDSTSSNYTTAGTRHQIGKVVMANDTTLQTTGQGFSFNEVELVKDDDAEAEPTANILLTDKGSVLYQTVTINELAGKGTLVLNSSVTMTGAQYAYFVLGGGANESVGEFSGTLVVTNSASSGSRTSSLRISDAKIAKGAVISFGSSSTHSQALIVATDTVKIAGVENSETGSYTILSAAADTQTFTNDGTTRTLVIDTPEVGNYSFGGALIAGLNIVKDGAGKQTFSPNNDTTFNGTVEVKGGTLEIAATTFPNTSMFTVRGNATLNITGAPASGKLIGGSFTIDSGAKVTFGGEAIAYQVKDDGLYAVDVEDEKTVVMIGADTYVLDGTTVENLIIKTPVATNPSTSEVINSGLVTVEINGDGKVLVGLNNENNQLVPVISNMEMPENAITFTINNAKQWLYYAVVEADEPNAAAGDWVPVADSDRQAIANGEQTLSIGMPTDNVRFYKIRTQLRANPTVTP